MTGNVPRIAVQTEMTREPDIARSEYRHVRNARDRNPTPARTRASAPKRLRSRIQRRPEVRKFDRPRSPKKMIPLVMIPSGGRTKRPLATIKSDQNRRSFRRFVLRVKTMPTIRRKKATPMRPTKSGRRSGNARATGGLGFSAGDVRGAGGPVGAGGVPARSGSREPQYTQNATSASFSVPHFGHRTRSTWNPPMSGRGLRTFVASIFFADVPSAR